MRLKHEVVIDVLAVALGFVVRVVAGCLAIPVLISPWILFCTFNLALFVALCKRRAELLEVGSDGATRGVLKGYTAEMLDTFISVAAGLTIISYSLYTFQAPLAKALGTLIANAVDDDFDSVRDLRRVSLSINRAQLACGRRTRTNVARQTPHDQRGFLGAVGRIVDIVGMIPDKFEENRKETLGSTRPTFDSCYLTSKTMARHLLTNAR